MTNRVRLVRVAAFLFAGVVSAHADSIVTKFSFETSFAGFTAQTTQDVGPMTAEIGTGTASGHHVATSTTEPFFWDNRTGNGSSHSFAGSDWDVNDYFEFAFTTNYSGLTVSWDQTSSAGGPGSFKLQQSSGGAFSNVVGGNLHGIGEWWWHERGVELGYERNGVFVFVRAD